MECGAPGKNVVEIEITGSWDSEEGNRWCRWWGGAAKRTVQTDPWSTGGPGQFWRGLSRDFYIIVLLGV